MPDNVKLTFAAKVTVQPIVPLCSRKPGDSGALLGVVGKTDNAAILSELARVKAVFQLRAICAAMGVNCE